MVKVKVKLTIEGVITMPLSDSIELFIKELMGTTQSEIELKRNEIAAYFGCAPSQINYVLATRFSPEHGYIIESQRGGSGYIRIIRILTDEGHIPFINSLVAACSTSLALRKGHAMVKALLERGIIGEDQAGIMLAAISDNAINLPISAKDMLRAGIMKSMLTSLMRKQS